MNGSWSWVEKNWQGLYYVVFRFDLFVYTYGPYPTAWTAEVVRTAVEGTVEIHTNYKTARAEVKGE